MNYTLTSSFSYKWGKNSEHFGDRYEGSFKNVISTWVISFHFLSHMVYMDNRTGLELHISWTAGFIM